MPYIVSVDLTAVARRLSRSTSHHHSDFDALAHLSKHHAGEPSPFRQTDEFGVFWTKIDPTLLLEPAEIMFWRDAGKGEEPPANYQKRRKG